jgi:hypothetical protein
MLERMDAKSLCIEVELRVDGDEIDGRARNGHDEPRNFTGWLGLIGALDVLITDGTHADTVVDR